MTEDEPTIADIQAAADRLCDYCRIRVRAFLGAHAQHPHHGATETLRRIDDFARQCCAGRLPGPSEETR